MTTVNWWNFSYCYSIISKSAWCQQIMSTWCHRLLLRRLHWMRMELDLLQGCLFCPKNFRQSVKKVGILCLPQCSIAVLLVGMPYDNFFQSLSSTSPLKYFRDASPRANANICYTVVANVDSLGTWKIYDQIPFQYGRITWYANTELTVSQHVSINSKHDFSAWNNWTGGIYFIRERRKTLGFPPPDFIGTTSAQNPHSLYHGYSPAMANQPIHRRGHSNPTIMPLLPTSLSSVYPVSKSLPVAHHRSASMPYPTVGIRSLPDTTNVQVQNTTATTMYYVTVPSHLAPRLADGLVAPVTTPLGNCGMKDDTDKQSMDSENSAILSISRNMTQCGGLSGSLTSQPVHPQSFTITSMYGMRDTSMQDLGWNMALLFCR